MNGTPYDYWRCSNCGMWVRSGAGHTCPTYSSPTSPAYTVVSSPDVALLERIATALERIANRLERMKLK